MIPCSWRPHPRVPRASELYPSPLLAPLSRSGREQSWPGRRRRGNALRRPPRGSPPSRHSEPGRQSRRTRAVCSRTMSRRPPACPAPRETLPRSLVPWLFGTWGPWAQGGRSPASGAASRAGISAAWARTHRPASRVCRGPAPRLPSRHLRPCGSSRAGPRWPHAARLCSATRCRSSSRQALPISATRLLY